MQRLLRLILLALALIGMAFTALAAEHRTLLTIKADGSSTVTVNKTESRAIAEQQARMWERYRKQNLGEGDEDAKPSEKPEAKPVTDEELTKKIREAFEAQSEQRGEQNIAKLDALEVKSNTVRTVTSQSFASLEDMLRQSYTIWGQSGLSFENVKFEKDSEGRLRVTLVPNTNARRYAKSMRQQWKLTGAQTELKLVFPGEVLSSGFPNSEGNATWLGIDAQKPETMDVAMKLYETPVVIVSELAGLKLDQPLQSKALFRSRRSPASGTDLPITDAGPGFVAEPVAVTTTTLHYFPDGEKHLKEAGMYTARTGTLVRVKFFAPKDRTLQSVSGVRVLKATDDKGRAIRAEGEENDAGDAEGYMVYSAGRNTGPGNSSQISLQLHLPPADAQSIDELSAEAVALTAGKWKEMSITNLTAGSTNLVDLAKILPGAKLSITKVTNKNRQFSVQARLIGPAQIRQIELQAKTLDNPNNIGSAYEQSYSSRDGQSTRALQLQHYIGGQENEPSQMPEVIVRFPEDQRRERVRFVLKGLDLF